ncbi:hypothetical protein V2J09_014606 [Rumex salicifolius]
MATDKRDFNKRGPTHLTIVDWFLHLTSFVFNCMEDDHHRRSVAAALVEGVYILEKDRQKKRHGSQARAPTWWEFFRFKLVRELVDDKDNSIIGAVFEYDTSTRGSPRYIVAFRGTILRWRSLVGDFSYNLKVIKNKLRKTARLEIAVKAVKEVVKKSPNMNVWVAGHSLGASIAMLAAKKMFLLDTHVESFLFNPPYVSAPIETIKDRRVKFGLRTAGTLLTAGLVLANKKKLESSSDDFTAFASWVPNLFVHPSDHICSEYIGYFGKSGKMEESGVGQIVRLALPHSLAGLMMNTFVKKAVSAAHLIPSARLTVNNSNNMASSSRLRDWFKAHKLEQWWSLDLHGQLHTDVHLYP